METKDYIIVITSGCALTISLISLIVTLVQKNRETKRTIRKNLTDTLENISKINIETTKLNRSNENNLDLETKIQLRRNYNTQRRILVAHADFLIEKHDRIAQEIDCYLLANAYFIIGAIEKAEFYWEKTILKSINPSIEHINLRSFGVFLFHNGDIHRGREIFTEATNQKLSKNDANKFLLSDTYLILSELEGSYDNKKMSELNLTKAIEVAATIINKVKRNEMQERIRQRLPKSEISIQEAPTM